MDVLNLYIMNLIAEYVLGNQPPYPIPNIMLFENNVQVTCATVLTDLDELVAPGYAAITLDEVDWTYSSQPCYVSATYPQISWTLTGPGSGTGTIYGHAIYDSKGSQIMWAQTWPTPFVIPAAGGTVTVAPSWQDQQCGTVSGIGLPFRRAGNDPVARRRRK